MVCKQPYSAFKSNTSAFSGRERLAKSVVSFRRRTFRERKWQWFTFLYSRLVHFIPDLATALAGQTFYQIYWPSPVHCSYGGTDTKSLSMWYNKGKCMWKGMKISNGTSNHTSGLTCVDG